MREIVSATEEYMDTSSVRAEQAGEKPFYRLPAAEVAAQLQIDPKAGLSSAEAAARLEQYGPNELQAKVPTPKWRRFLEQFNNPLVILLLVATVISVVAWVLEGAHGAPFEAIAIILIVLLNSVIGYFQEERAEEAVAALQKMAVASATVIREGRQQTVASRELVPGDILVIEEGTAIAADGRLLDVTSLQVAEAALTGESQPTNKKVGPIADEVGLGDRDNMVYSGTIVTFGRGRAVVTATGMQTQMGKIAGMIQAAPEEPTPLQIEIERVGRLLGISVIVIAILIIATVLLVDNVRSLPGLVDALILGVSLAVAAVPEGLPTILTVVLALGVQRMVARNAIVKKLLAVETLGSASVICTDKTGTLTKNEMTVRTVVTPSGRVDLAGTGYAPFGEVSMHDTGAPVTDEELNEELRLVLGAGALANNAVVEERDGNYTIQGDPTEAALLVAARKLGITDDELTRRFSRIGEVPFSSERKMMSTVQRVNGDSELAVITKGAPDVLLARCDRERVGDTVRPLTEERRAEIRAVVETLAAEALRTLGLAYRRLAHESYDEAGEHLEADLVFLGIVGIIDPPRPEAATAVKVAQSAGIRVLMITGDHPVTASTIAQELGILSPHGHAVSGAELQRMDDAALHNTLRTVPVYARVSPEHKLRIVKALREQGEVTAMTGDGVNDAPALKTADIGVSMGITGTDVAKEAADMILTDDNFATIVAAVEEGRTIFANIKKFLRYLLSSNIGEVLTMFFGVVFSGALGLVAQTGEALIAPLLATQILWINLLTDAAPALAVGVDPVDPDLMKRRPRRRSEQVIDGRMWFDIIFIGLVMAAVTLAVLDMSLAGGLLPGSGTMRYAQTMAFTTLVFCQLFNVFNARSDDISAFHQLFTNKWLWGAIALSILLQVVVVYVPLLNQGFGTAPIGWLDWLICAGMASIVLWMDEIKKVVLRTLEWRAAHNAA